MLQALLSITNETTQQQSIGHTHDAATGFATAANPPTDGLLSYTPTQSFTPTIPETKPTAHARKQITFRRLPGQSITIECLDLLGNPATITVTFDTDDHPTRPHMVSVDYPRAMVVARLQAPAINGANGATNGDF